MAKRKRRQSKAKYETNIFTGRKERVPGPGEQRNFITGKIEKAPKNSINSFSGNKPRTRRLSKKEQESRKWIILLCTGVVLVALFFEWAATHVWQAILIMVLIIAGVIVAFLKIPALKNKFQKQFKTFSKVTDEEIKKLISDIKSINMQEVRNEEDFEKQIYQWLNAKEYAISRQVVVENQRRIDLIINNKIALELKIADRAKNIQDLIGQVTIYKKYYKSILVVILDAGKVQNLSEYIEHIQNVDPENIAVVLISGDIRRYKKKQEYIMVKKSTSYD